MCISWSFSALETAVNITLSQTLSVQGRGGLRRRQPSGSVFEYIQNNTIGARHDFIIAESQNFESMFTQPTVSIGVFLLLFTFIVLAAVGFNDQLFFKADKVDDERPDSLLSSKLQTFHLFTSKNFPQLLLRVGHALPETASDRSQSALHSDDPPSIKGRVITARKHFQPPTYSSSPAVFRIDFIFSRSRSPSGASGLLGSPPK